MANSGEKKRYEIGKTRVLKVDDTAAGAEFGNATRELGD